MRIALLSDCYPPRLGGIETQVRDLGRQLVAAGHEVHVFTATPGAHRGYGLRNVELTQDHGVSVHRVTLPLPFGLPVNPLAPALVREELRAFDVAHVHMGVVSPFATALADLALELRLPTAITWHSVLSTPALALVRRLGTPGRWVDQGAALSAVSTMAARLVRQATEREVPVAVLPNGIDLTAWRPRGVDPSGQSPGGPSGPGGSSGPGRVRIVTAMRFAPRKRVRPLLGMLRQVRDSSPERVSATVFGDGPLLAAAQLQSARDSGWLDLAGRVSRPELASAYAAADLYLAPTHLEAFGIAALEARAAGLPVVAIASSGVADFIEDDVNGLLAADDADLVAAARRLVADDALRQRIRAHNLATPPDQQWPHVVGQALAQYELAAERRRERAR
ncbi:MAG: glycosyltransferase family 4 protein [Nostocoides sp.]